MRLSDYSREVVIEGTSREQVDGLLSVLSDELRARSTWFGGFHRRSVGGLILMAIGWGLIASVTAVRNQRMQIAFLAWMSTDRS